MDSRDFSKIMHAWLRLPAADIARVVAALRRSADLPGPGRALTAEQAAVALVGVMRASVDGAARGLAERCQAAAGMSLEGTRGQDPLDGTPRTVFCRLVGESLGMLSTNGYLNFAQTIGAALRRHRDNLGALELERVAIRICGTDPVGLVEAREADGALYSFRFSLSGEPAPTGGLVREIAVDRGVLAGIAFVVASDAARADQ